NPVKTGRCWRSTACHEVSESHFGNPAQIRIFHPYPFRDFFNVQLAPADICDAEFSFSPILPRWHILITNNPAAVGQFQNDPQLPKSTLFRSNIYSGIPPLIHGDQGCRHTRRTAEEIWNRQVRVWHTFSHSGLPLWKITH